jgi:signal transduction histidine kinase
MEVRSHCSDREPVPTMKMPGVAVLVNMDREKMASVLTHLVRNAQDATPPDGRVDIELAVVNRDVVISVADTGRGMDYDFIRDRLFRPFDTTKGSTGMGIGAYQLRHVVRAAGGDVQVESQPGVGTTFRVKLPAAAEGAAWQPKPAA